MENYFKVLKLDEIDSIKCSTEAELKNLKNQSEAEFNAFTKVVEQQFNDAYNRILSVTNNPRIATQKDRLNLAKKTLLDRTTRDQHITDLLTPQPDPPESKPKERQSTPSLIRFRNGDEATSIPQLATLMEKNAEEATDMLYQGELEKVLEGAGETASAQVANAVVRQFSSERDIGLTAMVAVLRGKVLMQKGSGASTPKQLARLIDQNWEQAKTLLYNGFIEFWLEHTKQSQLADTANKIANRYSDPQDNGLEMFVQTLDPQIGTPILEINHSEIDFGTVKPGSQKTIHLEIKNAGRGFLRGNVQLADSIPELQISDMDIQGDGVITLHLDAEALTFGRAYQDSLVINTNGGDFKVPIYINYKIRQLVHRFALSGISLAAILLVTRLIIPLFEGAEWAETQIISKNFEGWTQHWKGFRLEEFPRFGSSVSMHSYFYIIALAALCIGIFVYWCLVTNQKLPSIKNPLQSQKWVLRGIIRVSKWVLRAVIRVPVNICKFIIRVSIKPFLIVIGSSTRTAFQDTFKHNDYRFLRGHIIPPLLRLSVFFIIIAAIIFVISHFIQYIIVALLLPIVAVLVYPILGLYAGLTFLATNVFIGLDKLFYLGFNVPIVAVWAFWGLVIGLAIRGGKEMKTSGRKRMGTLVALAPVLLLCVIGIIKYASASKPPSIQTTSIGAQSGAESETETVENTEPEETALPEQIATEPAEKSTEPREPAPTTKQPETALATSDPKPAKQPPTEPTRKSTEPKEPAPTTEQQAPTPPLPTQPKEATLVPPNQEIRTTPTPEPKPITPPVPSDMILILAGEFQMGSNDNTDEKPIHTVHIDAFYIDIYEVTNAQYKAFVDANPQWRKNQIPSAYHNGDYLKHWNGNNYPREKGEHPVTYVSWYGAMAYANWVGKRLPTEAEWEKAARGGQSGLKYPWGNTISNGQANYGNHVGDTTVVGNYAANGYGLYDMTGNVLEWCLDAYYGDFYASSPRRNPLGGVNTIENADLIISDFTNIQNYRVVRSGAWYNTEAQNVRVAYRNRVTPTLTNVALGFRCVKAVTPLDRN